MTAYIEGIDVSNHQGIIEWQRVARSGKQFAFVKATEGDYFTDGYFARNRTAAKAAGLLVSAYHYFRPEVDPVAQAKHFCDVVGTIPQGELQPALDFEEDDGVPKDLMVHNAVVWLTEVENRLGRNPIIYSYPYWFRTMAGNTLRFCKDWPLWVASYGVARPSLFGGWKAWTFWQTSSTGKCPGVAGNCDMDVFFSDIATLRKFAGY